MADVFISYSRDDRAVVRPLAEAVTRAGYSLWWDEELPPHLSYADVIAEQIGKAKAAIVVWSGSAAASQWVRAEADLARNQKKLVQTSIDGRMPPMPFDQLHFVMIGDWRGEEDHPGWRKVKESLAALCTGAAAAGDVRPAYPMPAAPPPRAAPPSTMIQRLLVGLVAVLLLIILAGGALLWMRGTPVAPDGNVVAALPLPVPVPAPAKPAPAPAPEPATHRAPARPAEPAHKAAPAPAEPRRPVNLRQAYRYCMGRGRGSAECAELRRQYGR
jgi:TIR domain